MKNVTAPHQFNFVSLNLFPMTFILMKINLKLTNGEIDIRTTFHIKPKTIYTLDLYVNILKISVQRLA